MPQVNGFTSGLNIWLRANFMNVICDRGGAISELDAGTERGIASFVRQTRPRPQWWGKRSAERAAGGLGAGVWLWPQP